MDGLKQIVAKLVVGLVHREIQLVEAAGTNSSVVTNIKIRRKNHGFRSSKNACDFMPDAERD